MRIAGYILGVSLYLHASYAHADNEAQASSFLPVRANIVQCGTRIELKRSCEADRRCCSLLDQFEEEDIVFNHDDKYESIHSPFLHEKQNQGFILSYQ